MTRLAEQRRLTPATAYPRAVPNVRHEDGTYSWQIMVADECVALVSVSFTAAGDPARVHMHAPVDLPIDASTASWLVAPSTWADYACRKCGAAGFGTPAILEFDDGDRAFLHPSCAVRALQGDPDPVR